MHPSAIRYSNIVIDIVMLGGHFGGPSGVQVALGCHVGGPSGVQSNIIASKTP